MLVEQPVPRRQGRPRWRVLLALVVVALWVHWVLLRSAAVTWGGADAAPAPAASVQVRTVLSPPPPPALAAATVAAQQAAPPPARPRPRVSPRVVSPAAAALPAPPPAAVQELPQQAVPALSATLVASADASVELVAVAAHRVGAEPELPIYRTVMPPAVTLRYALQRGLWSGTGELTWRPSGDRYEARLEGHVAGLRVLTQVSQGGFDRAGIAPLRFTDQRVRRAVNAANFQRDKGKLTYSGPATEVPLVPGAQDRLSWMIQLAAVIGAEPQRAAPGGKVAMFVTGARADADVWAFDFVASETVQTESGAVNAVKFAREPRRPYDTQVEVWLDPARHYLPVRAKMTTAPDGDAFELLLRDMQ
jgi:hypothetical protein